MTPPETFTRTPSRTNACEADVRREGEYEVRLLAGSLACRKGVTTWSNGRGWIRISEGNNCGALSQSWFLSCHVRAGSWLGEIRRMVNGCLMWITKFLLPRVDLWALRLRSVFTCLSASWWARNFKDRWPNIPRI